MLCTESGQEKPAGHTYLMTPLDMPVAMMLMEVPSGAVEKHTDVMWSRVVTLPTRHMLIVWRRNVEPPLSASDPTVAKSPDTSLTHVKFTCTSEHKMKMDSSFASSLYQAHDCGVAASQV